MTEFKPFSDSFPSFKLLSRNEKVQLKKRFTPFFRALRAPPDTIRDILEGVMVLMGNPDTSWLAMKR